MCRRKDCICNRGSGKQCGDSKNYDGGLRLGGGCHVCTLPPDHEPPHYSCGGAEWIFSDDSHGPIDWDEPV